MSMTCLDSHTSLRSHRIINVTSLQLTRSRTITQLTYNLNFEVQHPGSRRPNKEWGNVL